MRHLTFHSAPTRFPLGVRSVRGASAPTPGPRHPLRPAPPHTSRGSPRPPPRASTRRTRAPAPLRRAGGTFRRLMAPSARFGGSQRWDEGTPPPGRFHTRTVNRASQGPRRAPRDPGSRREWLRHEHCCTSHRRSQEPAWRFNTWFHVGGIAMHTLGHTLSGFSITALLGIFLTGAVPCGAMTTIARASRLLPSPTRASSPAPATPSAPTVTATRPRCVVVPRCDALRARNAPPPSPVMHAASACPAAAAPTRSAPRSRRASSATQPLTAARPGDAAPPTPSAHRRLRRLSVSVAAASLV